MKVSKQLWVGPKCQRPFANVNQWHSCGHYTVEEFLKNGSETALTLYEAFAKKMESIGPFLYVPVKTRIGFRVRMTFAVINKLGKDYVDGHLILNQRCESEKFYKIEFDSVHHFRIKHLDEIDEEFVEFMKKSYWVGEQRHLNEK